jgi:hypothetical protein
MFIKQLLKLLNKLITMTEQECTLNEAMRLKEAALIAAEKASLMQLYQSCVQKIATCPNTQGELKESGLLTDIRTKVKELGHLLESNQRIARRVFKAQERFVERLQKEVLAESPVVKSYTPQGLVKGYALPYSQHPAHAAKTLNQVL